MLRLWRDDSGAVVSVEWCLITAVLVFGLTHGLVAMRDAANDAMADAAEAVRAAGTPRFGYQGYAVQRNGRQAAAVGGVAVGVQTPGAAQPTTRRAVTVVYLPPPGSLDPAP